MTSFLAQRDHVWLVGFSRFLSLCMVIGVAQGVCYSRSILKITTATTRCDTKVQGAASYLFTLELLLIWHIHIFVTRTKTSNYSDSNPPTNQRIINGFEIKTSQWAVTSKSPRIFFQTAWPQALEKHIQILFNFCEVTAEGYICLDQYLTSFALIYLDSASPLFTSRALCTRCNFSNSLLRGCLHDTGATFAPERVHSGSLSWLYICLHDTTTKGYAGASHPGVSSPRFSHRGENFTPVRNLATVSCKREKPAISV